MNKVEFEKKLPYSADKIYELVMDIENYPSFVPWCCDAKITEQIDDKNLVASMTLTLPPISQTYLSRVEYYAIMERGGASCNFEKTKNASQTSEIKCFVVNVTSINGPFSKLSNKWTITPCKSEVKNSCTVHFSIEFSMKSSFLDGLIKKLFEKACEKLTKAFQDRADDLFGDKNKKT